MEWGFLGFHLKLNFVVVEISEMSLEVFVGDCDEEIF